jgi:hypothetical protein
LRPGLVARVASLTVKGDAIALDRIKRMAIP